MTDKYARRSDNNHIDRHVGLQLRRMRILRGLTQEYLAGESGVSFQQIQKYERGANRIAASRLYILAGILNVEPAWFFAGLQKTTAMLPPLNNQDTELLLYYKTLPAPVRHNLLATIKSLPSMTHSSSY